MTHLFLDLTNRREICQGALGKEQGGGSAGAAR